ncbi:hypothetical protein HDU98_006956, partial [Podochytrium sp. JEL0797]
MPIAMSPSATTSAAPAPHQQPDEKPTTTLAHGMHQFLTICTSSVDLVHFTPLHPLKTRRSLKGDPAFEYIHRIVLATTAPAATLVMSLLLTVELLEAMRSRDDAMLKGFFYEAECELVSQKVLAIWSVAMIIADANMNDNAFAATSWAQVTVFKEARVVAAWKRWASDLMDWDFDVKERDWNLFMESPILKSLMEINRNFAVQIMLLQTAQHEKDEAVIEELSRTQLHPSWTAVHHEQVLLQQKKLQEEQQQALFQQQQQQLLQQQQQQQYNSISTYTTPPFSPVFQSRGSSLQPRRSLPVLPQQQPHSIYNPSSATANRYSSISDAACAPTLAPIVSQPRSLLYQHQLHPRASIPRLNTSSTNSNSIYGATTTNTPTYNSPAASFDASSRVNSFGSLYDPNTPGSSSCATPVSVRLGTPVDEYDGIGWELQQHQGLGIGRKQSYESFRDSASTTAKQLSPLSYVQQQQIYQPQQQQQQQSVYQQQQQPWAIPAAAVSSKRSLAPIKAETSGAVTSECNLSTSLSSMQLGETPPASSWMAKTQYQHAVAPQQPQEYSFAQPYVSSSRTPSAAHDSLPFRASDYMATRATTTASTTTQQQGYFYQAKYGAVSAGAPATVSGGAPPSPSTTPKAGYGSSKFGAQQQQQQQVHQAPMCR